MCQNVKLCVLQSHTVLRNYRVLHLFFVDPVRLGNRTYRAWGENRTKKRENSMALVRFIFPLASIFVKYALKLQGEIQNFHPCQIYRTLVQFHVLFY